MTTKTSDQLRLEITRLIDAPRESVYAAWANPAQLKQWWGPENVQTRELIADVRVGGEFRWDLVSPEGEQMTAHGNYREVEPGRKISFTWQWEDDENWVNNVSVVTVEFADRNDGTEVRLTHEQLPNEQSRDNHTDGWGKVLDGLDKFFKSDR